jgi:hypothetical protein
MTGLNLKVFYGLLLLGLFLTSVYAQLPPEPREWRDLPTACVSAHDVGKLVLGVSNKGYFGNSTSSLFYNCIDGDFHYSGSEYPRNSLVNYIRQGSVWIGGVRGHDTLVSEGFMGFYWELLGIHAHPPYSEMNPEEFPFGAISARSSIKGSKFYDKNAVSHQDLMTVYTDTIVSKVNLSDIHPDIYDYLDLRLHKPLYIEVTQNSYAWSHEYTEDLVLFEMSIKNIGEKTIEDFSCGISLEPFVGYKNLTAAFPEDDFVGFLKSFTSVDDCRSVDTLNLVWLADNDGDPSNGGFTDQLVMDSNGIEYKSATDAIGALFISIPDNPNVYFNWWTYNYFDFGPMARGNYRNFQTGFLGEPKGDRNKFFVMGNGETDYDPAYAKQIDQFNQTWLYPDQEWVAQYGKGGLGFNSLLSFQDGFLTPGGSIPIVFAIVMAENFHTDPNNLQYLPDRPDRYYANLDFSDFARNAKIAKWIYDNPGVDTDKDGYAGEFTVCVIDSQLDNDSNWIPSAAETTYYKGDGVPDWKPALPPPAPETWVTPTFRGIHIRFNGQKSENSKDIFTQMNDFEGYNIYMARDEREQSFSLVSSYDIENYDKYIWNYEKQPDPGWDLLEFPMTLKEIRCNYAFNCDDSAFDPLRYRSSQPYRHRNYPESLFYWEKHLWNVSEFGVTSDIKKKYPNARDPRTVPLDLLTPDDYTDDGYLKYFEYEYTIKNILPTVPYYVSVTTFDFGWPASRLEPLETSITDYAQQVYASVVDSAFAGDYRQVVVYPNPYRINERYRQRGFEGLGDDLRSNERVRRIHFANLPHKCIIKILSLDGDLVREIHHDKEPNDPTASNEEWGLISRNGLAVVSGLYYWVVEFDDGTVQMGKLAIIL